MYEQDCSCAWIDDSSLRSLSPSYSGESSDSTTTFSLFEDIYSVSGVIPRRSRSSFARSILINAQNAGVAVPRDSERKLQHHGDESEATDPDNQTVLEEAAKISDHVSRVVFPAFSPNRGKGCVIHENAYWGLQTYLGLRERLAANEGARSFIYESTRDRTPLGYAHREHIRDLSINQMRSICQ
jgi:hypothetical protein